jgi:hypothetical protein
MVQDSGALPYPTQQLVISATFLLILFILTKMKAFSTSGFWVF